jgi:excinuclease UvrABC nuclease subunit
MDSNSLSRKGFERWQDFSLKAEATLSSGLPTSNGVYVIKNDTSFGRFVGESDIIYIGSASDENGLRGRILQYFNPEPTQSTNKRINGILHLRPGLKISYILKPSADDANALESSLLKEYDRQHGERPPANRKE